MMILAMTGYNRAGSLPVRGPLQMTFDISWVIFDIHLSRQVDYQKSVVSLHKDPVGRLLREGVDIVAGNQTILLNSKEEFLQGAVPSTRTQRGFGR